MKLQLLVAGCVSVGLAACSESAEVSPPLLSAGRAAPEQGPRPDAARADAPPQGGGRASSDAMAGGGFAGQFAVPAGMEDEDAATEEDAELVEQDVIPAGLHAGDGTARMIARLAELARRGRPEKDLTLNDARVPLYEGRIEEARKAGKPTMKPRFMLATEKLNSGRSEDAAKELTELLATAESKAKANPEMLHQMRSLLGVAWLRVGEQSNCVEHHGAESCLLPITEGGRHMDATGSRHAMEVLGKLLVANPDDFAARWLLNVAAMTVGEWPDGVPPALRVPASAFESEGDVGHFANVAGPCGLASRGLAGGVCLEDFDGDGLLDLLTSEWAIEKPMRFQHNDGNGLFTDKSVEAGVSALPGGLNLVHADVDNDGDADVLVLRGAWKSEIGVRLPLSLLINDGHGAFTDRTEEAGVLCFLSTQAASFGDFDGDGWLDLFVGNESVKKHPGRSRLFHNDGDGTFTEVGPETGLEVQAYVKGCAWGDADDDGDADLAVSRMDGSPLLFRNDGAPGGGPGLPRFTNVAERAGLTEPAFSFPCWWFDYDNDGHLDLYFAGYGIGQTAEVCRDYLGLPSDKGVRPRLYRNRGDGTFENVTAAAGLMRVMPTMGCNFGDLDNDGWLDFYLATGEPDLRGIYPNRLFHNVGGRRFEDVTTSAGMGHLQKGHGIAFGDIDRDGDQDVFAVMGGAYSGDVFQRALFENPGHGRHWVTLLAQGTEGNRAAIGARLRVTVRQPDGSTRDIHQVVGTGGSFGSESLQAEIGLGDATAIESVEVRWPGGGGLSLDARVQRFGPLPLDSCWRLVQGRAEPEALERPAFKLGGS